MDLHDKNDGGSEDDVDLEWEEWDPARTPKFIHHCIAGSVAGISEHTIMYPLDTIKTHMQCASCPNRLRNKPSLKPSTVGASRSSVMSTFRYLMGPNTMPSSSIIRPPPILRLWRGVTTMLIGCAPAHALYFSSYELVRHSTSGLREHNPLLANAATGVVSTLVHDSILTPLDTVKQRLQLGYYKGVRDCVSSMLRTEGYRSFYKSYPTTLVTNAPYGAVMVATNEFLRDILMVNYGRETLDIRTTMLAGTGAGAIAAAITTPLDCVKTRLQTQPAYTQMQLRINSCGGVATGTGHGLTSSSPSGRAIMSAVGAKRGIHAPKGTIACPGVPGPMCEPRLYGFREALLEIVRADGIGGLFRGLAPRLMTHAPAVAISWTTYESIKDWLQASSKL